MSGLNSELDQKMTQQMSVTASDSEPLLPIQMTRHQQLELGTISPRPRRLRFGLGWSGPEKEQLGFFDKIMGVKPVDLDASCILLDSQNRLIDTVWFRNLRTRDDSVRHMGDSLDGEDRGMQTGTTRDDEVIDIDLKDLDDRVNTLVIGVSSFNGQTFEQISKASCRIYDRDSKTLIAEMNLSHRGSHTGVLFAMLKRFDQHWLLTAMGTEFSQIKTVDDMAVYVQKLLTYDV